MLNYQFQNGIWLVDFEFHPLNSVDGNLPVPVCMVARELNSKKTIHVWRDELLKMKTAPFPHGSNSLFVAYYASAEINCFMALNWPTPVNVLDLYIEFRNITNGKILPLGSGLIGALSHFGLDSINGEEKDAMRDLVLRGGSNRVWGESEKIAILEYCKSDVEALNKLLPAMLPYIDTPRALLRGQYAVAISKIEYLGVPIEMDTLNTLKINWSNIQSALISKIDNAYGVYVGSSFKLKLFEQYLIANNIAWPTTVTGQLDLNDDTFKDMSRIHPQLTLLKELRCALSQMRLAGLSVGEDGRNRCILSIFKSKTGRNQPSTSKFIFGPSVWLRGLIKPAKGFGIAYIDWSQQEFGIAAALSQDEKMMEAYRSGDPYLTFAKQSGYAPLNATKQSHKAIREQFKACVLAVQYGMGAESLSIRINQPIARARELLDLHRRTYKQFWKWLDCVQNQAILGGRLWTTYGWQLLTEVKPNLRSLSNFPMQANGAEMLRLACISLTQQGIRICAPVHDAILIEAPLAKLDDIVKQSQLVMRDVSSTVLNGFHLESEVKVVRYPERYMDERGIDMWNSVMSVLDLPEKMVASC